MTACVSLVTDINGIVTLTGVTEPVVAEESVLSQPEAEEPTAARSTGRFSPMDKCEPPREANDFS